MAEQLEISPISYVSSCFGCAVAMSQPEANHSSCRRHRVCFNRERYDPEMCDTCTANRDEWIENKDDEAIEYWRKVLNSHQKNTKGYTFAYGNSFNSFFKKNKKNQNTKNKSQDRSETPKSRLETTPIVQKKSPSFDDKLKESSAFKEIQESLKLMTQHILSSNQDKEVSRDRSLRPTRNKSPSTERRSGNKRNSSSPDSVERSSKSSRSRSSRSFNHRNSSSPDDYIRNKHQFDYVDPKEFKSEWLQVKGLQNGQVFFYLHPNMIMDDDKGLYIDDTWQKISRHPTDNTFKIVDKPEEQKAFVIQNSVAVETIKKEIGKDPMIDLNKIGSASKAFKVPAKKAPFLIDIAKIYKSENEKIISAIMKNDHAILSSVFNNFKSPTDFCIDEDWILSPTFKGFATPEVLKPIDSALLMTSKDTPFVPDKFLKKEKDLRMSVVDTLSGFFTLGHNASKAEAENNLHQQRILLTAAKQFLPAFKNLSIAWIKSKVDIRRIFLQDSKASYAHSLILSNPWCSDLFDPLVIKDLKKNDLQGRTLLQACGWSESRDKQLKTQQHKIDLSQPSLINFDKPSSSHASSSRAPQKQSVAPYNQRASGYKKPYQQRPKSGDRPFRGGKPFYNKGNRPSDKSKKN